ncbi:MAG: TRAFAC clade GTPase domain-containing protein [Pseudonocardiaceae bacterium]
MPAFIAALIGIALYGAACYIVLVYLVDPAWPFVVLGAGGLGVLLVVVMLTATLLRVEGLAAETVTPLDVRTRLPEVKSNFERDSAWPGYLFAQSRTDLVTALKHTTHVVSLMWASIIEFVALAPAVLIIWPLLLLPLAGAFALTAGATAGAIVVYGLLGVVLILAWLGWLAAVGLLRGVDFGVRVLRGAKATCHYSGCNYRNRLPAYRCACGQIHHDIRAGRLGAFVRRCKCGSLLPTTVLQAATGLVAVCQKCDRPLRVGAAVLTDVLVPVFGPPSAGKTRLVFAGMVALARHLTAAGGSLRPVGTESEDTFRDAITIVESGAQTTKTDADRPPAGITVRLTAARRKALLHLFDAAGEFFSNREQNSELPFLDDAQGLVFVLDPFSVPAVADELTGNLAARLTAAQPAGIDPEQSYLITAQWLRDQGVKLTRKPLAVAVVKADLLLGLPCATGLPAEAESGQVEVWLRDKGLDNMLDGAARDFGEIRYFLVSSLNAAAGVDGRVGPVSPAHPLLWLLGRSGVSVPAHKLADAS